MNARQRLRPRAQNSRAQKLRTTIKRETTPRNYPVVTVAQAKSTGTRSDTLLSVAGYHARQGNSLIASRLRKVAAEVA